MRNSEPLSWCDTGSIRRRAFLWSILCVTARRLSAACRKEDAYRFTSAGYDIGVAIEYYDRYSSEGFHFKERASKASFCFGANGERNRDCLQGFAGSLATVEYRIRPRAGNASPPTLREHVRTIDQAPGLPERRPFDSAIELVRGIGSDVQAFGIEVDSASPEQAKLPEWSGPWCYVRQDLYLNDHLDPFLVIHWKHELARIRMLDAIPGEGTSAVAK
jgi:hypothetical protein